MDYCGVLDGTDEERERWRALLAAARANGVATAVLSNNPGGSEGAPVRALEEEGIVDVAVLSGEVGAEKPEPGVYDIVAERLGLPVKDCVLVDDSIVNIHGAVERGMVGVFYQQFDRAVVEITGLFDLEGEF